MLKFEFQIAKETDRRTKKKIKERQFVVLFVLLIKNQNKIPQKCIFMSGKEERIRKRETVSYRPRKTIFFLVFWPDE